MQSHVWHLLTIQRNNPRSDTEFGDSHQVSKCNSSTQQCDLGKVLFNFSEFHMIYLKVREEHHKELCLYKVVVKANNTAHSRGSASRVYLINNKQRSFAWSEFHLFSDFQSVFEKPPKLQHFLSTLPRVIESLLKGTFLN